MLSQGQNFGPEAAAAIMAYNPEAARAAETAPPSTTAAELARTFRQSGVGEDIATRNRIDEDKRDEAGKLLADWQTKIGKAFLGHPIAGMLATQTGVRLGADLVKWAFTLGNCGAQLIMHLMQEFALTQASFLGDQQCHGTDKTLSPQQLTNYS